MGLVSVRVPTLQEGRAALSRFRSQSAGAPHRAGAPPSRAVANAPTLRSAAEATGHAAAATTASLGPAPAAAASRDAWDQAGGEAARGGGGSSEGEQERQSGEEAAAMLEAAIASFGGLAELIHHTMMQTRGGASPA